MPEDKEAPVYTAERILLKRVRKGKTEYFIKWKGWAAKYNTWEPERHILDKLLIEDFNNRNRKQQKSKSLVRHSVTKRQSTIKTRPINNAPRTRRLLSSSSSDISTSALASLASPVTNDENNDEESFSTNKLDSDRTDSYKLRSKQPDKIESNSFKESEHEESNDDNDDPPKSLAIEQDSLKEYLWQPTKLPHTSTTITEVTDQSGVTVLIRQLNEVPTPNTPRSTRVLGYGSGGRGGRH